MVVTLQLRQIDLQPGQCLTLREISWAEFEAILEELGEHRAARVAYYQGVLEIRMPSPEHEVDKELIGDMVKILLDELELDWEPYGSTTFKRCLRPVSQPVYDRQKSESTWNHPNLQPRTVSEWLCVSDGRLWGNFLEGMGSKEWATRPPLWRSGAMGSGGKRKISD